MSKRSQETAYTVLGACQQAERDAAAESAAVRAILWRVDRGLLDPEGAATALDMLGLTGAEVSR